MIQRRPSAGKVIQSRLPSFWSLGHRFRSQQVRNKHGVDHMEDDTRPLRGKRKRFLRTNTPAPEDLRATMDTTHPLSTWRHVHNRDWQDKREPKHIHEWRYPRTHTQAVSYTHLRAHETDSYLVCRLLLEKKKK